jgi:tetratricopeptide (TPR) repeat protein
MGRDGDLYTLDRALDASPRVLVHGVAAVGKTTLIEHLLHWRERTGGADRSFTFSFRATPPLLDLVERLEDELAATQHGLKDRFRDAGWAALSPGERLRPLAALACADVHCKRLFFFDNVETLSGYPDVGPGAYDVDERRAFREFLLVLKDPPCKVLLTSRRDELEFLGDDVRRIRLRGVRRRDQLLMLLAYAEVFAADGALRAALADPGEKPLLDELLRSLSGHPLATRVAAYGLRDRSLADVLASIHGESSPIEVPVSGQGYLSENLTAVVEGMLQPLPEPRRLALGVLGLFSGSFAEQEFVALVADPRFPAGGLPDTSDAGVRQVITEALRLGLLGHAEGKPGVWEVIPGAHGALERLWKENVNPDISDAVERHVLRYWADAARRAREELHSREGVREAIDFGSREEGNLRRGLVLAERYADWNAARVILELLVELWPMMGRSTDADKLRDRWLRKASGPGGQPSGTGEDVLRLWLFLAGDAAIREVNTGRVEEGWARARLIVDVVERSRTQAPDILSCAYSHVGRAERVRNNLTEAERWFSRALDLETKAQDQPGLARTYFALGRIEMDRGSLDEAERLYHESLRIRTELGDYLGIADCCYRLGKIELERRNTQEAEKWFRKTLKVDESLGNKVGMANSYHQLGRLEHARENRDIAEAWYRKAVQIDDALGDRAGMSTSYYHLSELEAERQNLSSAEAWCRKMLTIAQDMGNRMAIARGYTQLGTLLAGRGDHARSQQAWRRAVGSLAALEKLEGSAAASDLRRLYDIVGRDEFLQMWRDSTPAAALLAEVEAHVGNWSAAAPGSG